MIPDLEGHPQERQQNFSRPIELHLALATESVMIRNARETKTLQVRGADNKKISQKKGNGKSCEDHHSLSLSLSLMFFLLSMMSSISGTRRQLEDKTKPTFDR